MKFFSKRHIYTRSASIATFAMKLIIIFASCLSTAILGATVYSQTAPDVPSYREEEYHPATQPAPKPYSFGYSVKDEDSYLNYGRQETSDGRTVRGSYHVLLPDGRLQKVTYKADSNGYVADVTYENPSNYS